jgi:uncharacterized protein YbjT (DUF2867 family)
LFVGAAQEERMILVIGANGNIGSQVVQQLLAAGEKVRVLVRDGKKATATFGSSVDVVTGDIGDAAALDQAFAGAAGAFVLTSGDAVLQEKNAFAAAKKAGTKHVVKLSVAGAMRGSPLRLADNHAQSEEALKASGVAYTILQPHSFMSNVRESAGSIKGDGRIYGASKEGGVPYIDTGDIAAVGVAALRDPAKHGGQTYFLTGPEAFSQAQIAEKIGKAIGKTVTYVDLPPAVFVDNLKKFGVPGWLADDFGKMNEWFASGAAATVVDTVEKVTGRKPRTFDAWLSDNVAAFR